MFGVMAGDHAYTLWLDEPLPERGWTSDQVDELHADLAYWDAIGTPRPKVRREQSPLVPSGFANQHHRSYLAVADPVMTAAVERLTALSFDVPTRLWVIERPQRRR
jgi:hypothetical protein